MISCNFALANHRAGNTAPSGHGCLELRAALFLVAAAACAQTAENVVVVVNTASPLSGRIADYYVKKRAVPAANVCRVAAPVEEIVSFDVYYRTVEAPLSRCLRERKLTERTWFLAVTQGVPLRIANERGSRQSADGGSVDGELALLHGKLGGRSYARDGRVPNPYFGARSAFERERYPMFLVTRLAAYTFDDVKAMIDRGLAARNAGKVVLDVSQPRDAAGDEWLRETARRVPKERLVFDESVKVPAGVGDVIAHASWGSNDKDRTDRWTRCRFLPGAIATQFVSSDGRTEREPPAGWNLSTWKDADQPKWFAGSPQSMSLDFIREGATGVSGHVDEPFLNGCPRPEFVIPNYLAGRTLAEAYYSGIPFLSWMNVVFGDPLARLR